MRIGKKKKSKNLLKTVPCIPKCPWQWTGARHDLPSLGTSITSCNNFHLKASEMELYDMLTSQPGLGTKRNRSLWSVTQRRRVANSQHRAAGSLRHGTLHTYILDLRASALPPFTWEPPSPAAVLWDRSAQYGSEHPGGSIS